MEIIYIYIYIYPPFGRGWCLQLLIESAQPTGDELSSLFPLVFLPVRECVFGSDTPDPKPFLHSQCPQLGQELQFLTSGLSCQLPKSNPSRAAWGGGPMEVRVALFPALIEGLGASNSCRISPMTKTERGRDGGRGTFPFGRSAPQTTHSLTDSLTH